MNVALDELKKFLGYFERDYGYHVELIVTAYDNDTYNKDLEPYAACPRGKNAASSATANGWAKRTTTPRRTATTISRP
jgi:hypothetical protein